MRSRKKLILAVLFAYLVIALGYAFFAYSNARQNAKMQLESKLSEAACSLDVVMGKDFYDVYTPERPLSGAQNIAITDKLDRLVASFGIDYLYSLVKIDNELFFTISNGNNHDVSRTGPSVFYKRYPKPSEALLAAFRTGTTQILYFPSPLDRWNSYYSIFIPRTTSLGVQYVLAADITIEHQKRLFQSSATESLVLVAILLIPFVLGFWFFSIMTRRKEIDLGAQLYYDLLTGLPNLNCLMKKSRVRQSRAVSIVVFNIDAFRNINSLFGMQTGDETLVRIGDILASSCSPSDCLYKLPADEYLVETTRPTLESVRSFAEKALSELSTLNFNSVHQPFDLTFRAGIVFSVDDLRKSLSFANMAVRAAQDLHRDLIVYDSSINRDAQYSENIFWLGKLKDALKSGRIVPFYQPICENATGEPALYEALVRMIDSDGTEIAPVRFLDAAKQSKLYRQLTHIMIQRSLENFSGIGLTVSINFSARDIDDEETVSFLFDCVARYSMQNRVVVELVETEALANNGHLTDFLERSAKNGVRLAIDDFGSGYSNFENLAKIDADFLKIDGAIVHGFLDNEKSSAMILAILSFARQLGIAVVAEYVSEEKEFARLRELGVHYTQGFYFGKPVRFEEVSASVRKGLESRRCPAV